MSTERFQEELQGYRLEEGTLPLIRRLLISSPTCAIDRENWLPLEGSFTLASLHQAAPRGIALTLFHYACSKDRKRLNCEDILFSFATNHLHSTWEWIRKGVYQSLGVEVNNSKDEATLLFIHSLNLGQVAGGNKVLAVRGKVGLSNVFLPRGIPFLKKGDWVALHCGWIVEKVGGDLAREILTAQKEVELGGKPLPQIYSQLPNEIDFETVFGGLFSGRRR